MADRIRVIIADDHKLVRQGTRELLNRQPDIDVVGEAADGEEAVVLVDALLPDVALLDVVMPRVDGLEACRRIKQQHPDVAVLALTIHDDDEYVLALLEAGASGYMLKDADTEELADAIRAVRGGKGVLHPGVVRTVLDHVQPEPGTAAPDPPLSDREFEVLKLAAEGLSNKEIAERLGLSVWTVQTHLGHVFEKLGTRSRTQAVVRGLRAGWLRLDQLD